MKEKISVLPLILLIFSAICSIRALPTTAFFGSSMLFFFLLSALIFLIPISLVSAEFSSRYPDQGGIFHWIRHAFGDRIGVLAVWLQWTNTMVWYPTMLLFISGTAAHLINPLLAEDKVFLFSTSLCIFWGLTLLNLKGIQVSAKISSFCGTIGTLLPMIFLILLGLGWVLAGNTTYLSFSIDSLLPSFEISRNVGVLTTIMASFLGMELAGVHVNDVLNPQKNFPKAIAYSAFLLLAVLILGSLSVGCVVERDSIHFADGVMQTFNAFFDAFNIPFLTPVLAVLIIVGGTGGSINWLLSPAKGLLQVAEKGFFPSYFLVKNSKGVPVRILILQALVVSLLCLANQLVPSINAFYWFFMSLSTSLYMLMYALLFLAALKLGRPMQALSNYQIPRGVRTLSCLLGLVSCLLTILIGFEPIEGIEVGDKFRYATLVLVSLACMISPVVFLWVYQIRKKRGGLIASQTLSVDDI